MWVNIIKASRLATIDSFHLSRVMSAMSAISVARASEPVDPRSFLKDCKSEYQGATARNHLSVTGNSAGGFLIPQLENKGPKYSPPHEGCKPSQSVRSVDRQSGAMMLGAAWPKACVKLADHLHLYDRPD
ncbi:hypothetical protein V493_04785 [Pseudogymnoascus sp. VKM F-4281 (FW-2241)]|nr:hypothetical protein V493_04785 [Pseudogymnoascus sp. VKM F-4281 (FW-2241)]